ncbi:MAG: bacterial Ig-like domain-containing protein, partial [Treponema sp.]|nr:bacterial Ig-like domain-containing protein [Treponema sp.]
MRILKKLKNINAIAVLSGIALSAFLAACPQPVDDPADSPPVITDPNNPDNPDNTFVPVTGISGVPTGGAKGAAIDLSGAKAAPGNATNKTIVWTLKDEGRTALSRGVDGNTYTPQLAGNAALTATIINGLAAGQDFTRDFELTITEQHKPVTDITGVPQSGTAGAVIDLTGVTVAPADASNQGILWTVAADSQAAAEETAPGRFKPASEGALKLIARISKGKSPAEDYTQTFTITIAPQDTPQPPANLTGIALESLPDIIVYARGQPFSAGGLKVKGFYSDETERLLESSGYILIPASIDTSAPGPKEITVKTGSFTASFRIMVNTSDKILQSVTLTSPPSKTVYELGENIGLSSFSGMVITGAYSDGSTKTESVYAYSGYDRTKRGTQTIGVTINRHTVTFDVTVKIPSSATARVNNYDRSVAMGGTHLEDAYKGVYLKGRASPLPEGLKVTVTANGVTSIFTAAKGDFSASDLSGYAPNQAGDQTLTLTLDDKTIGIPIYVIAVEPQLFFDYGYWRHTNNPNGGSPAGGSPQYTVPAGETLVITPVVFFLNTAAPSYSWSVSGGAPSTSGAGNKFLHITPASPGTYTATVTVSAGGVTKTASAAIVCTASRPGAHPPEVTNPSFTGPIPAVSDSGNQVTIANIRNFAPGQFTRSGTGYGWSLGAVGGDEVWKLRKENNGTKNIHITGNPLATWSEPGIVWVSVDDNQNGLPDDTWYELKGGDDESAAYQSQISRSHGITYIRNGNASYVNEFGQTIDTVCWVDSKGRTGVQPGGWSAVWGVQGDWVTFSGTLLREDGIPFIYPNNSTWGYVDITPTQDQGN